MTTPNDPSYDPLAKLPSTPAVSFDPGHGGTAEGDWAQLIVTDYIKLVQDKDDNGRPKFYEDSGDPVMKAVLAVEQNGEKRSLWIKKNWVEGGLFRALADAQEALGERIGPGTKLAIRWRWDTSKPKKLGNHPKAYEVKAQSGPPPAPSEDPLAGQATTPAASSDPWATPVAPAGDEPPF